MKKTFRERVISRFTHIAKKHKLLCYPCLAMISIILAGYHMGMHFVTNTKRYASIAFVIIFFMASCSFSFAVFAEKTGFIKAQETYSAIVEDSDISLAVEPEVDPESHLYMDDDIDVGYDMERDVEEIDAYTLDDIMENRKQNGMNSELVQETPEVTTGSEGDAFDASDWRLVLINKQHPIPENYEFKLATIKDYLRCDERIIDDLFLMMQAAKKDGVNLEVKSPYRTEDRQEYLFNKKIKAYMGQGMSYMDAYKISSQVVTVPGSSEHQIGLALDIACDTYTTLDVGFGDTEAGQWLAEHSCEYGFTLRYPLGKEYITSIEFEPWHFRYVGREAAMTMKEDNLCLEEFWDKYL